MEASVEAAKVNGLLGIENLKILWDYQLVVVEAD
jgi:hypothetical protein